MDIQDFIKQLNQVEKLMQDENYTQAISLLENLKEIESRGDFNYNLTHRLYQLDSNARSFFNQQQILEIFKEFSSKYASVSFHELNQALKDKKDLHLSYDILKREIEILILRNLISCKINGEKLIF